MSSYSPGRPATDRDIALLLNGAPMFPQLPGLAQGQLIPGTLLQTNYQPGKGPASGILTSSGAAVNNVTTATPFATGNRNSDGTYSTQGSMSGRVYLVQATADGALMASDSPLVGVSQYWTVALSSTIPPLAQTFPGVPMSAGDVRLLIMTQSTGWLQWVSALGSLVCTELF